MSVDRYHSLPKKKQPTQSTIHTRTANPKPHVETIPCPEISEFKTYKSHNVLANQSLYIKNLYIDYGHLEQPHHYFHDKAYNKVVKFNDQIEQLIPEQMETKRLTGISLLTEHNDKQTEKKKVVQKVYVQVKTTEDAYEESIVKKEVLLPVENIQRNVTRPKVKLQQVRAYNDANQRDHTNTKRRLHSRIVKMLVGGGQTKTKVICYPDNSEYLKLWGQK